MGRNVPFRWSLRLQRGLFRPLSEGFMKLSEKPHERANLLAIRRLIAM
jgi:hypothetical protein